jgi:hypothetical protein
MTNLNADILRYISPERLCYLEQQHLLYEQAKPGILQHYLGEYVAVENGQVLDHDQDDRALAERVHKQFGAVLIIKVIPDELRTSVGGAARQIQE